MENIRYNVVNSYKEMLQLKDMPEEKPAILHERRASINN